MDKVIVYGLGNYYDQNIRYINENYDVIGYSDRNSLLKVRYGNEWIDVDDVSVRVNDADFLLISFAKPLSVDETEQLCKELCIEINKIRFLYHEIHKGAYLEFAEESQKMTRKLLNDKQISSFDKVIENNCFFGEFRIEGGERHRDKTFFIIRYDLSKVGLFTAYNVFAGHIKYAVDKGLTPVIDMQNYPNIYLEEYEYGKKNTWEMYFQQPCGYGVEEAYSGANIIMSDLGLRYDRPFLSKEFYGNVDGESDKWRFVCHKYMRVNSRLLSEIEGSFRRLKGKSKVLGVFCRGTDYVSMRYPGHPVQPNPIDVIEDTKIIMAEQGCDKVFVGTEDQDVASLFQKEFGDRYITNNREFVEYNGGLTCAIQISRQFDRYLQGKEYLTTMVMCSLCDCILASRANGSVGFFMISDGWEYEKVYYLGEYPNNDGKGNVL